MTNKTGGIRLTWTTAGTGLKYEIYRKTPTGKFKYLAKTQKLAFTDTTAKNGKTYRYKVRAYREDADLTVTRGKFSQIAACCRLVTPEITAGKNLSYRKILLNYSKNAKASGYIITYSTSSKMKNAAKIKVKTAKTNSVTFSVTRKKNYYLRVQSYVKVDGKTYKSAQSEKLMVKVKK